MKKAREFWIGVTYFEDQVLYEEPSDVESEKYYDQVIHVREVLSGEVSNSGASNWEPLFELKQKDWLDACKEIDSLIPKIDLLEKQNKIMREYFIKETTHNCYSWDGLVINFISPEWDGCECTFGGTMNKAIQLLEEIEGIK